MPFPLLFEFCCCFSVLLGCVTAFNLFSFRISPNYMGRLPYTATGAHLECSWFSRTSLQCYLKRMHEFSSAFDERGFVKHLPSLQLCISHLEPHQPAVTEGSDRTTCTKCYFVVSFLSGQASWRRTSHAARWSQRAEQTYLLSNRLK